MLPPNTEFPASRECDVLVVGAGPAGVAAAVSAARTGASVVLVEQNNFLGGTLTIGLPILTYHDSTGRQVIRGFAQDLVDRLARIEGTLGHLYRPKRQFGATVTPVESEAVKRALLDMVEDAGVTFVLSTVFDQPLVDDEGHARGAIFLNKGGRLTIEAAAVIDATGDADVAASIGASHINSSARGINQPGTLMLRAVGVDTDQVVADLNTEVIEGVRLGEQVASVAAIQGYLGDFGTPDERAAVLQDDSRAIWFTSLRRGIVDINISRVTGIDPTSIGGLTDANVRANRQLYQLVEFMKRRVPSLKGMSVASTFGMMGIRESRHIVGEYTLNGDDLATGLMRDDTVAFGAYAFDVHAADGSTITLDPVSESAYGIPLATLIPKNKDGILVAGRAISADSRAFSSLRVMATCMAMGQAAGVTGALSAIGGRSIRALPVAEVQEILRDQGAFLGA